MLKVALFGTQAVNYDLGLSPGAFVRIENFKMHLHELDVVLRNQLPFERKILTTTWPL